MSQISEMYLEQARVHIGELQAQLEIVKGELGATNMLVQALLALNDNQATIKDMISQGISQYRLANPSRGEVFIDAFDTAVAAALRTMEQRKIPKGGE